MEKSSCCSAGVTANCADEGTCCYICRKCGKPCDSYMPTTPKKALITGINGQDGYYLTELLLHEGYEVHGIIRRKANVEGAESNQSGVTLHYGDMTHTPTIDALVREIQPDEVYNLAAQSHVGVSFKLPEYTADVVAMGTLRLLEAVRRHCPKAKFYQASTSEMFGNSPAPQNESTPFSPRSPYGVAKLFAHEIVKNYRESYKMHASCGILFNHESPRRGYEFVTRKITNGLAKVALEQQDFIELGNLDAKRDWGHAKDYVHAMWNMLQKDKPGDYVIATGRTRTIREFVEEGCKYYGMVVKWKGKGVDEVGIDQTGQILIKVNPEYYRPAEVDVLCGNPQKAKDAQIMTRFTSFETLVHEMCENDFYLNQ